MAIHNSEPQGSTGVTNEKLGNEGVAKDKASLDTMFSSLNDKKESGFGSLTFGSDGLLTSNLGQGAEYTQSIKQTIESLYKGNEELKKLQCSVYAIDRTITYYLKNEDGTDTTVTPAYSYIVVSLKAQDTVTYFILLLEATGRRPLKADDIMRGYDEISKGQTNDRHKIYTADDTITVYIHRLVKQIISKDQGITDLDNIRTVDGCILPSDHEDFVKIAPKVAQMCLQACYLELVLLKKLKALTDLNIYTAVKANPGSYFKYDAYISKQIKHNPLHSPIRCDWILELNAIKKSQSDDVFNVANSRETVTRVGGFIESIPEEYTANENNMLVTKVGFKPNIIITSNEGSKSTLGFVILGLMSGLIMSREDMYLKVLRPEDNQNVGALNIYSKLNGKAEKINLADKSYTPEQVYAFLKLLYCLPPVISMDIESYGPETFSQSALSKACSPQHDSKTMLAAEYILDTVKTLTNNKFPSDFPVENIFSAQGIVVPLGTYLDKGTYKDIREIDLAFLANRTTDFNVLNQWVFSNLPSTFTGTDSFINKVSVINRFIPEAEITGKAIRVTFTSYFLETLSRCIQDCGLNPKYDPEVKLSQHSDLSQLASYYQNASLNTNFAGFGTANAGFNPMFNIDYSNMGMFRFQR